MALRVALLTLVTCTFAVAWSGDCPDPLAVADHPTKAKAVRDKDLPSRHSAEPLMVPLTHRGSRYIGNEIPLPSGIVSGTYLVADQFGRTVTRIVSADEAGSVATKPNHPAEDHYALTANGSRWHFIRINPPSTDQMAVGPGVRHVQ